MDTYGNTGNEGQRGYGDGNGDMNTYGNRGNEPSRRRDYIYIFVQFGNRDEVRIQANLDWTLDELHKSSAKACDVDSSQCHSSCCGVPLSGNHKVCDKRITNGSTVFLNMNGPTCDGEETPTPGTGKNEPSRHKEGVINLFVDPGNGKQQVTMEAKLSWTLDKLHRSSVKEFGFDYSQFHSSCCGVPLSGDRKVCDTRITNGSTVFLNFRGRGG